MGLEPFTFSDQPVGYGPKNASPARAVCPVHGMQQITPQTIVRRGIRCNEPDCPEFVTLDKTCDWYKADLVKVKKNWPAWWQEYEKELTIVEGEMDEEYDEEYDDDEGWYPEVEDDVPF